MSQRAKDDLDHHRALIPGRLARGDHDRGIPARAFENPRRDFAHPVEQRLDRLGRGVLQCAAEARDRGARDRPDLGDRDPRAERECDAMPLRAQRQARDMKAVMGRLRRDPRASKWIASSSIPLPMLSA